ncbi:MAG: hypothetical protein BWY75_01203 [bacterium ADurb.Bin425]|nr:MAG: hypothetical protein BWY75_01203 [bacterium ADurb.Bin425]
MGVVPDQSKLFLALAVVIGNSSDTADSQRVITADGYSYGAIIESSLDGFREGQADIANLGDAMSDLAALFPPIEDIGHRYVHLFMHFEAKSFYLAD